MEPRQQYKDIEGEFVGICDDSTWVSEALEDFDDKLEKFFAVAEEVDDDDLALPTPA